MVVLGYRPVSLEKCKLASTRGRIKSFRAERRVFLDLTNRQDRSNISIAIIGMAKDFEWDKAAWSVRSNLETNVEGRFKKQEVSMSKPCDQPSWSDFV